MFSEKKGFNAWLKIAGLTKKEFAQKTGLAYSTVANWGSKDKPVPPWVVSWILNYRKAKTLDSVKDVICNTSDTKE